MKNYTARPISVIERRSKKNPRHWPQITLSLGPRNQGALLSQVSWENHVDLWPVVVILGELW